MLRKGVGAHAQVSRMAVHGTARVVCYAHMRSLVAVGDALSQQPTLTALVAIGQQLPMTVSR